MDTNWTKKEFKTYLLLYAAQANYIVTAKEKKAILLIVGEEAYTRIEEELEKDNDYQSIQKIQKSIDVHNYSGKFLEHLIDDIKKVFFSDGSFDVLEKNMMLFLKKILR